MDVDHSHVQVRVLPVNVVYGIVAIRAFVIVEKIDFAVFERGSFGFFAAAADKQNDGKQSRQFCAWFFPLFNAAIDGFADEGLHFGKRAGFFGAGSASLTTASSLEESFLMSSDLSSIHLTSSTLSMFMFSPQNRQ